MFLLTLVKADTSSESEAEESEEDQSEDEKSESEDEVESVKDASENGAEIELDDLGMGIYFKSEYFLTSFFYRKAKKRTSSFF